MSDTTPNDPPPWQALLDSEDLRRDLADVFDDAFLGKLASEMGREPSPDECQAIMDGLEASTRAYLDGQIDLQNYRPEKVENRTLQRVADEARRLHEALMVAYETGGADKKLAKAIRSFRNFEPGSTPAILSDLASRSPANPLLPVRDLVTDIGLAAEDAINQKPTEEDLEWEPFREKIHGERYTEASIERWRRRSAEHRLPKDHALQRFIAEFGAFWLARSDRPFTEGMHHAKIGTTVSHAVDALELIFARLDPAIDRPIIVTAMRKARKSRNSTQQ